jgi:protein O-mannosyl-transferase
MVILMTDTIKKGRFLLSVCLLLALVTLAVFWRVTDHEFVIYDDGEYVVKNAQVQAGLTIQGVKWAFTTFSANWHPLTWLSHMLDCQLFGLNPAGHHGMSLFFHIANTLLLFLVLCRMTKALWRSAFVAALFALHPLHVESVAWVAERKDVLSAFFFMLTMGAYVRYVERPDIRRYIPLLVFFVLGLMSKPMLVTLPFVLLLLDYWPLGRLDSAKPDVSDTGRKKRKAAQAPSPAAAQRKQAGIRHRWRVIRALVWEKVPLFAFSAVSSVITFYCQQKGGTMVLFYAVPLDARVGNALVSYVVYLGKMIWPQNLAVFYPHPVVQPVWHVLGAALVLVAITILAIRGAKRFPWCAVGWLWFLGTLVPVIGLVQVGMQAMADRYTYIPFIGLFIVVAWGIPEFLKTWRLPRAAGATSAVAVLVALMFATLVQLQYWRNSITLFSHTIAVTTDNAMAYMNLGTAWFTKGNFEEAIAYYRKAIRIHPDYGDAYNNMATVFFLRGEIGEAESALREALRINPDCAEAHYNLGTILASRGTLDGAAAHFQEALRIIPGWAKVHNNLGSALLMQGNIDGAVLHFREALRLQPDYARARDNLSDALKLQREKWGR